MTMKFLQKYAIDIGVIMGVILSTIVLMASVDEAPTDFYIKHLMMCLGVYTLASVMYKLVYFVCRKIKR